MNHFDRTYTKTTIVLSIVICSLFEFVLSLFHLTKSIFVNTTCFVLNKTTLCSISRCLTTCILQIIQYSSQFPQKLSFLLTTSGGIARSDWRRCSLVDPRKQSRIAPMILSVLFLSLVALIMLMRCSVHTIMITDLLLWVNHVIIRSTNENIIQILISLIDKRHLSMLNMHDRIS